MNFLAIDSTGHFSSVGIFEIINKKLILKNSNFNFLIKNNNKPIDKLISQTIHTNQIANLEFIVVSLGPGSFTKIRSSLAFAKGLSSGLKVPIIGINGFQKLFEVGKSLNKKNTSLLIACDTFRKSAFVSLQNIRNKSFDNEIEISAVDEIQNIKDIKTHPKITVLGDLSSQVSKHLKNNGFKVSEKVQTYGYKETGLTALVNIALKIKKNNDNFNLNPIYISAPLTNERKNRI